MNEASQVSRVRRHLLNELRTGLRRPGSAISVKETAITLGISHTPVREALERMAGEGVVHPGEGRQGFTVARYGVRDLTDLYGLLETLMGGVLATGVRGLTDAIPITEVARSDPVGAVEDTIGIIASGSRNRMVSAAILRTSVLLAPYRLAEPVVLPDWVGDLNALRASVAAGQGGIRALRAFIRLRTTHAVQLVDACAPPDDILNMYQV